ncbi:MAG TPA: urease accessory UreF family protein [Acidimicrobiales bacterium]|nr:urease accessory UreF family protein [Acidimicrobiales bacterium]
MSVLAALLLADGRFPAGGHAHSGGLEEAATTGLVHDLDSLRAFVVGRLATAGRVAAGLAAVACGGRCSAGELDGEADARMASPALRNASRRQGRQLVRAASHAWPIPASSDSHHHAVAVGLVAAAAGLAPVDAARWAAYDAVMTPATAAVRLLGLDPFSVSALVAALAPGIDEVADEAAAFGASGRPLHELPCPSAPLLDLGAEAHALREVRLFAS